MADKKTVAGGRRELAKFFESYKLDFLTRMIALDFTLPTQAGRRPMGPTPISAATFSR
jgi:hypothetical protein